MAGCRPVHERYGSLQAFGENKTQFNSGAGHSGRDYSTPVGTPTVAIEDGTVIWADESWNFPGDNSEFGWISRYYFLKGIPGFRNTGSGRTVIVEHDDCLATYSHLSEFRVTRGQKVKKGQVIALTGDTGIVIGAHLHFEIIAKPFNWYNGGFYGRVNPDFYTTEPFRTVTVQGGTTTPPAVQKVMNGVDVASWQKGIDFKNVPGDFVIVKVTGGTGYVNPEADAQIRSARAAGKMVGLYHFANDVGFEGKPAVQEAEFFLAHARKYLDDSTVLVLDWEGHVTKQSNGNVWARDFLNHVKEKTGETPWLYANPNDLNRFAWATVAKSFPLWVAAYGGSGVFTGYATDVTMPAWAKPKSEFGFKIIAWQYSGNGKLSGYAGAIDLNVFYGNRDTWRGLAQGGTVTPVPVPPVKPPSTVPGRIHIVQPGEYLKLIADMYGTTPEAIRALNAFIKDPNYLAVGDRLALPAGTVTRPTQAIVEAGDSMLSIAEQFGIPYADLLRKNPGIDPDYIQVGWVINL